MTAEQFTRALVALEDRVAGVAGAAARELRREIGRTIADPGRFGNESLDAITRQWTLTALTHRVLRVEVQRPHIVVSAADGAAPAGAVAVRAPSVPGR